MAQTVVWHILPKKYRWIAQNADGVWYAYAKKPHFNESDNGYTPVDSVYLRLDLNKSVWFPEERLSKREM